MHPIKANMTRYSQKHLRPTLCLPMNTSLDFNNVQLCGSSIIGCDKSFTNMESQMSQKWEKTNDFKGCIICIPCSTDIAKLGNISIHNMKVVLLAFTKANQLFTVDTTSWHSYCILSLNKQYQAHKQNTHASYNDRLGNKTYDLAA